MSTSHPFFPECVSLFWKGTSGETMIAWDPGYGSLVRTGASCHPQPVTEWWLAARGQLVESSIGPVVCPVAYRTVQTSVNLGGSTFVGCCPRCASSGVLAHLL
jgi:hypothetical protein